MDRPYVVCHMLASLDGKIDGAFMAAPEAVAAGKKYGSLREFYACQATLYGTVTVAGSYSEGYAKELPHSDVSYPREDYIAESDVDNYIVSVDPKGVLGWNSKYIEKKKRPRAHVIEVLTGQVSEDYLAYLRGFDISYIFAGEEQLDCRTMLDKLKNLFGIQRLVVAPVADGGTTSVSIFEKAAFLPERKPAAFSLKEVQTIEDGGLWLRYLLKRQEATVGRG